MLLLLLLLEKQHLLLCLPLRLRKLCTGCVVSYRPLLLLQRPILLLLLMM